MVPNDPIGRARSSTCRTHSRHHGGIKYPWSGSSESHIPRAEAQDKVPTLSCGLFSYLKKPDKILGMKNKLAFFLIILLVLAGTFGAYRYFKSKSEPKSQTNSPAQTSPDNQTSSNSNPTTTNKQPIATYQVPILMYHYIRDFNDPNDTIGTNLSVSLANFDSQMKWLKDNGYETVNPDYLTGPYKLETKPIIITFDDGYRDAYTNAFPILKKYGFSATFYIITSYIDKNNPDYMTWDELRELEKNNMNIGSHTLTHPDLEKADSTRVDKEIGESQTTLQNQLGIKITDFCYPSGKYDSRTINALKKYNYKTAVTVKSGIANETSNLFELPRIRMINSTSLAKTLE